MTQHKPLANDEGEPLNALIPPSRQTLGRDPKVGNTSIKRNLRFGGRYRGQAGHIVNINGGTQSCPPELLKHRRSIVTKQCARAT